MSFDLTPSSAYMLGAILTDGMLVTRKLPHAVQRVVAIGVIDKDFAEAVADCCFDMTARRYVVAFQRKQSDRQQDQWRVQMTNRRLHDWIFDVTHGKTRVPTLLYRAPYEIQRHFLAGVMDGDGWVSLVKKFDKPGRSISSFTQIGVASCDPWIDDVKRLADVMGLTTHGPSLMKRNNPNWRPIYHLRFKAKDFVRAEIPLRIERKAARLRRLLFLLESSEAIRSEP